MAQVGPILMWFRRDLRLGDHPAFWAACQSGRPVIPVFIKDALFDETGAAAKWRLGQAVDHFDTTLRGLGARMIYRSGPALAVLGDLVQETGATSVYWSRGYDPKTVSRDTEIKKTLLDQGVDVQSFEGHLLVEPWVLRNKQGADFKVYSPYWRRFFADAEIGSALPNVQSILAPQQWPASEAIADWQAGKPMQRGAEIVAKYAAIGEQAAMQRLSRFLDEAIETYRQDRDFPSKDATSRLSENLTYGEISPRVIWHAGRAAMHEGARGAEHFCKELVWREFAYHILWHFPALEVKCWRPEWDRFAWSGANAKLTAWQQGQTGQDFVDAAMRELYVTGMMHNRLRMVTASFLTKHLGVDWRLGMRWFEETLIDWDPASNAMGWQWVAGCGPDAAPYFRVFNPATQAEKFDEKGSFRRRFLDREASDAARDFYAAIPRCWDLDPASPRPELIIPLDRGRAQALEAYQTFRQAMPS